MNPIRREVINGLFVLVISTLLSAAIAAFQVKFNIEVWVLIVMAVAIAVGGYVGFEFVLSTEKRETRTEQRELEWLKRIGTPARLEVVDSEGQAPLASNVDALNALNPGSDYTVMFYYSPEGPTLLGDEPRAMRARFYTSVLERLKQGKIREYKRIICFDSDVFANDHELRSGVLRVSEGPGSFIDRILAEHCRLMMATKGCSLYVAPVIFPSIVAFYGAHKVSMSIRARVPATGRTRIVGSLFFSDPPNGEIIQQFWDMERETERRMVAVHKIVFPEDAEPKAEAAAR